MTILTNLPPEVLRIILGYSSVTHKAIDLWKCGNLQLNAIMANGGCTEVCLRDEKWNSTSRWPKMLRHLRHLKSVRLFRSKYRLMEARDLGIELRHLPECLEELELECYEAESCFLDFTGSVRLDIPEGSHFDSQMKSHGTQVSRLENDIWDIGRKFPNLKTLILETTLAAIRDVELRKLPKSLTRLGLVGDTPFRGPDFIGLLPRSLQSATLGSSFDWNESLIKQLPPTITELSTPFFLFQPEYSPREIGAFPRTITDFFCDPLPVSPLMMELLPPHLISISIDTLSHEQSLIIPAKNFEATWFTFLPKHLTSLYLSSKSLSVPIVLAQLPRTLKSLTLENINWELNSTPQYPPHLTFLSIKSVVGWEETHWKLFPSTLRSLIIWASQHIVNIDYLAHLPSNLDFLRLDCQWHNITLNQALQARITTLHLSSAIEPSIVPLLPRSLTSATLNFVRGILPEEALGWPNGLTSATLFLTPGKDHSDAIFCLPDAMQTLWLYNLCVIPSLSDMEKLPRGMEGLMIQYAKPILTRSSRTATESAQSFAGLPSNLKTLQWSNLSLPPTCLEYLDNRTFRHQIAPQRLETHRISH